MGFTPITPFEPVATEHINDHSQWIAQVKWDGVRVLTYYDGESVHLYNRKKNARTHHYPELTAIHSYCRADSVILDGEVIALGPHGKPSFHEVMRRDGIRRMARVQHVKRNVPITYMIFDVIYYNGKWLDKLTLHERMDVLSHIISPNDDVQLVTSHNEKKTLFEVVKAQQMEGIVIKDLNSTYLISGKDERWQKKKNYQDLIAVVGGVTYRDGIVNAVLLGLYDSSGRFWYIGHAGTGKLKKDEWRALTKRVQPLIISEQPFVNTPERSKDAVWTKTEITVKIQFIEWTKGGTLRQPSIQAFVDAHPEDCVFTAPRLHS